ERHERIAAPLDETGQPVDLSAMKQQAPRARRIRLDMRRRGHERRDMRAEEPRLVVAQHDISLGELRFAGTQALDLPSLELDPRFEVLLDEIVETRLAVDRDRALGGLLFLLSGHRPPMILECTAKNTSGRGFLHECTCRAAPLAARRVDFASRV